MPGHPVKIWLDAHGPGGPRMTGDRSIQVKKTAAPLVGNPKQNTGGLDMKPGKVGFMKILESEASEKDVFAMFKYCI